MTRTHLFEVSTLFGLATLNAALAAGLFPGDGPRILICSNNAQVPEAVADLTEAPAFAGLAEPFDRVVSFNDAIAPLHPSVWTPSEAEMPVWERYFRLLWDLGDGPVHLVVESIQVSPAQALAWSFPQASIDVYADGLMSYGPTRNKILSEVGSRIERLLHLDLVPGLAPLLLEEFGVERRIIPTDAFRTVLADLGADAGLPETTGPVALLLGQYLSPLGLITSAEEEALHTRMLEAAVARGFRRVVFKPHPTAPTELAGPMLARAAELGAEVEVFTAPVLAETLFERIETGLVVGCFSTALMTAQSVYGLPVVRVGTEDLLAALKPFPNSNRIPLVIIDSLVAGPDGPARLGLPEVTRLIEAVGFVMQPEVLAHRRAAASDWLWEHGTAEARFFPAVRLGELGLPGGRQTLRTRLAPSLRRAARSAYAIERKLEERLMGPIRGVPGGG
ncbi:polysialyltransferase family glycosyltransferase [Granulicoccus sp. GXG6511]|uniref:polysialyltransferase family glycosyltransferase n=1 Tax=Granulicoccus sp. GXG6511 TaxID=3381351 RepID=UPI003D7EF848